MSMTITCTCGQPFPDLESLLEHRHDAHGDGQRYAPCCNCGKRRRKADMLRWPTGQYECVHCDGKVYLAKQRTIGQRNADYARSLLPVRQPVPPTPIAASPRFTEAWED